ncbi:MAG: Maf-like protein [Rickettsiales bacterium]|nr:MAG: Maf-like protein [Rickettsiales bacterium]
MKRFILGSGSASRKNLIQQAGFIPDLIEAPDIDETPLKKEKPLDYIKRIAKTKCESLTKKYSDDVILCADTIVSMQNKIFQKAKTDEEVLQCLKQYSGKTTKLITSVCVYSNGKIAQKTITTSIKYKNFDEKEIADYIKSKQGIGKAGGIMIEGMLESFVIKIIGNYSNIMGLPLYYVNNMLVSAGIQRKV